MAKTVCLQCKTEYNTIKSGAIVIEMFSDPPQPYKIWNADGFECPGCHHRIVSGFANRPIGTHYDDDFDQILEKVKNSPIEKDGWVIYDYERAQGGESFTQYRAKNEEKPAIYFAGENHTGVLRG